MLELFEPLAGFDSGASLLWNVDRSASARAPLPAGNGARPSEADGVGGSRKSFSLERALAVGARAGARDTGSEVVIEAEYGLPARVLGHRGPFVRLVAAAVRRLALFTPGADLQIVAGLDEAPHSKDAILRLDFQRLGSPRTGVAWPELDGIAERTEEGGIDVLARAMGGEVELLGAGELSLTLPFPAASAREADACGHAGAIVVVAERSAATRRSLRCELDLAGYSSVPAQSVAELFRRLDGAASEGTPVFRVFIEEEMVPGREAWDDLVRGLGRYLDRSQIVVVRALAGAPRIATPGLRSLRKPVGRNALRRTLATPREATAKPAAEPQPEPAVPIRLDRRSAGLPFEADGDVWKLMLGQFRKRYRDLCESLPSEIARDGAGAAAARARRIGAVASALGLELLARELDDLARSLDGHRVPTRFEALRQAHQTTFVALDGLLPREPGTPPRVRDSAGPIPCAVAA